jgi:phosphatidylglycerophosphate synthase
MVTWTGFVIGMGAAASIAAGWFTAGLVMILANRMCDGLDGAVARASRPSDVGGFLDITLDFIFYSAIPFAFCVNDTQHALAGAFLIFSFVGSGSSFLAFAIIAQKRGISTDLAGKKVILLPRRLDRRHRDYHFPDNRQSHANLLWRFGVDFWKSVLGDNRDPYQDKS